MRKLKTSAALVSAWACAGTVMAACNNPADWLESPKNEVKVFIGYEQDFEGRFAAESTNGLDVSAFPPPLPQDMLAKDGQGVLPGEDGVGLVSYYEPDGKGHWRVCRQEKWFAKKDSTDPARIARTVKKQPGNPAIAPLIQSHVMGFATVFLYDQVGRIQERFTAGVYEPAKGIARIGELQCFRYDDKSQLVLYVIANTRKVCPTDEPDPKDYWRRFRYANYKSQSAVLWAQQHFGQENGNWEDRIRFNGPFTDAQPYGGYAFVFPTKGVTHILGGARIGLKDESNGTVLKYSDGSSKPIEYYFTKPPVPVSILTDIDQIYRYDRRRETSVLSSINLVEFYPANIHWPRERFYVGTGRTLRQEHYDAQGKLKRVINLGFVGLNKKNGGFYDEDLSGRISLKLKSNKVHYRVWDYDGAGRAKLVAIGWNTKLGSVLRSEPVDDAEMAFGTPDGNVQWKTKEDFFRAFDFDPWASRAYPEEARTK